MALDLDKRSKVTNLCPWAITFTLPNSGGEVRIDGNKSTTINNGELVTMKCNALRYRRWQPCKAIC